MKSIVITVCLFFYGLLSFGQTEQEKNVLNLSNSIFRWEVSGNIDSLEKVFDEKFFVVNASGESQTKKQYLQLLRSGNFVHNAITVDENTATVVGNTATVVGKGAFAITAAGKKISLRLSYLEVFTRPGDHEGWIILAMHASILPDTEQR
jgi:hypothetical protein